MKKIIFILLITLTLSSCKTVKKEWLKENYVSKTEFKETKERQFASQKEWNTKTFDSLKSFLTQKIQSETSKTTNNETSNTTISGTMVSEEGKTKTVSFDGTTIKSDGASVSFSSTTSKSYISEIEKQNKVLIQEINEYKSSVSQLLIRVNTLEKQYKSQASKADTSKTSKSKDVKKSGFTFWIWFWIILAIIIIALFYYYRKTFFGRFGI